MPKRSCAPAASLAIAPLSRATLRPTATTIRSSSASSPASSIHRGRTGGDFDGWAGDPEYGAKLNLASLDLIQSRNHILRAALDALEPASRQLLSTLALLSDAVDYDTVSAFNPHIPPKPEEVRNPRRLKNTGAGP